MSDWIVIVREIAGSDGDWHCESYWDGARHATKQEAIDAGARKFGHDDFNIGQLEGSRLAWFGWMDKSLEVDRVNVARRLYLNA